MKNRLTKVRNLLAEQHLDAAVISSASNIIYLTGFFGFSKEGRDAYLLITKTKAYIFTNALYSEAVYNNVPHFTLSEITPSSSFKDLLKKLTGKHILKRVGIEENDITVSEYKMLSSCFNNLDHFSVSGIRAVKEEKEIFAIKKACDIADKVFAHILNKLKSGVTEQEIAFEIEIFLKENGADVSFPPIVAFGRNSSIPHHKSNNQKLITNNIVLLDFGARYNGYCSDMTRTVFFGKATSEQKRMYQVVLDAQQKAIEFLTSYFHPERSRRVINHKSDSKTASASKVDSMAREYIIQKGYPSIPHSLGHGIGLQVHEYPSLSPKSKDILREGMVFSIEPGIYIPGKGGIRIEDLFTIQRGKLTQLTHSSNTFIELPT